MTNEELFESFKMWGSRALNARNKCIGMLPEIYKRRVHVEKGFFSIYEFAAKFAGLSQEQVNVVLRLEKRFEDKPELHKALVNGEVSVNKLAKVVSIATVENQGELIEMVKSLSTRAVEQFVRDEKSLHVHGEMTIFREELQISERVKGRLLDLKRKGFDIDALLNELLDEREAKISQEKEEILENLPEKSSRYIPVKVRDVIKKEFGTKCSAPNCIKDSEQIHHNERFALFKSHNPFEMPPLCREHHLIAHAIDARMRVMAGIGTS